MNYNINNYVYTSLLEEFLIKNNIDYVVEYSPTGEEYYYTKEQVSKYQVWENTNDDYPYFFDEYVLMMTQDKNRNVTLFN